MKNLISITEKDQRLLLDALNKSTMPSHNRQKLEDELKNAKIYKESELPVDVICLNSEIELLEVDNEKKMKIKLVLPNEADMKTQKVSVLAPIGIALIGYRKGDMVDWEMPNGLKKFQILDVAN
ncbi:GreA/GreB family elongation factor [Solitalea canadensis]|uniref:Transcription elongation factor n=1 Tax=Solitalea canadensis (strain ATCC 29591 / DSM 3403 / JCM 21819 / LMG 8368 / NBRC 15130 / NCIMB 12057 / USAM 9D) TaxID=929556 RepID=H8KQ52_SOLCM|nr:GreA/GreB family elongation factor [Solitalea canadensis]AFD06220.1 transcription elongation factor [Solitalea canadensis DSM 3403]